MFGRACPFPSYLTPPSVSGEEILDITIFSLFSLLVFWDYGDFFSFSLLFYFYLILGGLYSRPHHYNRYDQHSNFLLRFFLFYSFFPPKYLFLFPSGWSGDRVGRLGRDGLKWDGDGDGMGWDGKESRLLLATTTALLLGMLGLGVGERE